MNRDQKFIQDVIAAVDEWYVNCPRSIVFVKKIIDLVKEYKNGSDIIQQ